MKAVNLIPVDAPRRDRVWLALSDGIGSYAVLAVLAVLVVMTGMWALSTRQLSEQRTELARVEVESQAATAKAALLSPYTEFAALRTARDETVAGLVDGRFSWSRSLREIGRVIPEDVSLTSLVGTASPASQVEGAGGGTSGRGAQSGPAVELIGCAKSQGRVARLLVSLRAIRSVRQVSLASSEKSESTAANAAECRATDQMPQFQLTVFYEEQPGISAAADATAPTPVDPVPAVPAGATAPAAPAAPAAPTAPAAAGATG